MGYSAVVDMPTTVFVEGERYHSQEKKELIEETCKLPFFVQRRIRCSRGDRRCGWVVRPPRDLCTTQIGAAICALGRATTVRALLQCSGAGEYRYIFVDGRVGQWLSGQ